MKLTDIIQDIIQTGVLPMQVERQMHRLLAAGALDEPSLTAIDELIEALCQGKIQSVA